MDWEIFTYGNGDFIRQVLNAVASIFGSGNYLIAAKIAAMLGFLGVLLRAAFDRNVLESFRWFMGMLMFCWVVMVPKADVIITDRVNSANSSIVANIPLGLAATAGLFSALGDALTQMTETVFSLPNELKYQESGLLFGHRLYDTLSKMNLVDERTSANYAEFVATCVIFDGIGQRRFTWENVVASTDLASFFSSHVAENVARFRYADASGMDRILPCRSGFSNTLLADIRANANISEIIRSGIAPLIPSAGSEAEAILKFRNNINPAFNYMLGFSSDVDDMVVQAALINAMSSGLSRIAQETGATEFNASMVTGAQTRQMSTHNNTLAEFAKDKLPLMRGVFEAFLYAIFPVVILLGIVAPAKTALNYIKMLLWINLWSPLFAILNFAITYWDRGALTSIINGGISGANLGSTSAYVVDSAAAAMLMATSLPLIAWFLVTGAGGMLAGIAAGMIRQHSGRLPDGSGSAAGGQYSAGSLQGVMTTSMHAQTVALGGGGAVKTRAFSGNEPGMPEYGTGVRASAARASAIANTRHMGEGSGLDVGGNRSHFQPGATDILLAADDQGKRQTAAMLARTNGDLFGDLVWDSGGMSTDMDPGFQRRGGTVSAWNALRKFNQEEEAMLDSFRAQDRAYLAALPERPQRDAPLPEAATHDPDNAPSTQTLNAVNSAAATPDIAPVSASESAVLMPMSREEELAALLPKIRYGMMGDANVQRVQTLLGMEPQYQTGNYRDLTRAKVQAWLGESEQGVLAGTSRLTISLNETGGLKYSSPVKNALDLVGRNAYLEGGVPWCTALVKQATKSGVLASQFIQGTHLTPENIVNLPVGTPIGTGWENGMYKSISGKTHVGLFGGPAKNGYYIVHQHRQTGGVIRRDLVEWDSMRYPLNGNSYYTILYPEK